MPIVLIAVAGSMVALAVLQPWPTGHPSDGVENSQSAFPTAAVTATAAPAPSTSRAIDETLDTWVVHEATTGVYLDSIVAVSSESEAQAQLVGFDPTDGVPKWSLSCSSGCRPRGSLVASPTGAEIAYALAAGTTNWIRAVDIRTGIVRNIADCGGCDLDHVQLAWSPDGATIAVDSGALGIRTVLAHPGTDAGQLLSVKGRDPSFSRDDKRLMYVDASQSITIVDAQHGSSPQMLSFGGVWWAAWSPDGTSIAFVVDPRDPQYQGAGDPNVAQLWVADLEGQHRSLLHEVPRCCIGGSVGPPTWSPDGTRVAWLNPIPPRGIPGHLVLVDRDGSQKVDLPMELAAVTPTWLDDQRSP